MGKPDGVNRMGVKGQHGQGADAYAQMLEQLYARQGLGIRLGLQRIGALCAALKNPQEGFFATLVAGTNGKGSTSFWLARALSAAGRRCGLFISPHLLRFGERIQIDGRPLEPAAAVRLYAKVIVAAQRHALNPSFFEVTTAMAFLAFAEAGLDEVILEVGLGGRLDATNVARRRLCVLTRIDYDHQQVLGSRLEEIAAEKAGILRPGCPVVMGPQRPAAARVVRRAARALGCPLYEVETAPAASAAGSLPPGLAALPPFLRDNLKIAGEAGRLLGIDPKGLERVAATTPWPGRYQWLVRPQNEPAVLLDGGHNPAGAAALVDGLLADRRFDRRAAILLVGAVQDKDAASMLRQWRRLEAPIWACGMETPRSLRGPQWAAINGHSFALPFFPDLQAAWVASCRQLAGGGTLVICGSLYLVGEALAKLTGAPRDPPGVG